MTGTPGPENVSTKLQRIAALAREDRKRILTTLAHHIDAEWMREAHRLVRKDGAAGVDGQTAKDYESDIENHLASLLERLKSGTYRAPAVRRVYIPKADGTKTRPIGIPTFEDKVQQKAVAMALEAVYEQDFLDCSYGFRPGRSAHDALDRLRDGLTRMGGGWVVEVDIKSYFDTLDHEWLRRILDQRVRDGVLRRAIDKWLKAGVLEEGRLWHPDAGTPQGGVISPLLANIYLHEVLDTWFERDVRPRLKGSAFLVRYADDFVICFERKEDAERVLDVLPKRFGKYGLTLHPTKTRLVSFVRPRKQGESPRSDRGTFSLLGFTHYWGRSRKGYWVVKRKTEKSRLARAIHRIHAWCKRNRHRPIADQHAALRRKLTGHYSYYGITGNNRALEHFLLGAGRAWKRWLCRRSRANQRKGWEWYAKVAQRYPLPRPRIYHSIYRAANPVT